MPELPEVEHLRRSLEPHLVGGRLGSVAVVRRDVIRVLDEGGRERRRIPAHDVARAVLANSVIRATHRHGKQLALEAESGAVLVVQLGMTGSLTFEVGLTPRGQIGRHRHVRWEFLPKAATRGDRAGRASVERRQRASATSATSVPNSELPWKLVFRDPRRFGGLTAYPCLASLRIAWSRLGPDALDIDGNALIRRLHGSTRPIKSALLDQETIAGVGNIYADESLYAARIHPLARCRDVQEPSVIELAAAIRRILSRAVESGGSTLQDYRDAFGQPGDAVQTHQAYGRAGRPCGRCGGAIEEIRLAGRSTSFCPRCQDLSTFL